MYSSKRGEYDPPIQRVEAYIIKHTAIKVINMGQESYELYLLIGHG